MRKKKSLLDKIYRIYTIIVFFPPIILLLWFFRLYFNSVANLMLLYSFWFTLGFSVAGYLFLSAIKENKSI
jgi:cellulose synthase/poly-beta-1,6-N-acetylglucosamine synthase-like glycosyltransferase